MGQMPDAMQPPQKIDSILSSINEKLPALSRAVIERHLDTTQPENRAFLQCPDDHNQHQTQWHQWGIITHTRVFLRVFDRDVPAYLHAWGVWDAVDRVLSDHVDGLTRWQLLHVSILLHDIGKFGARTRDAHGFHFAGHESLSGRLIREELQLDQFGLTGPQIAYVARTAEDHFLLGLLRKRARQQGAFSLEFTQRQPFIEDVRRIKAEHPDDFIEVGVLFLGDSLAKAEPHAGPDRAVSQNEVNVAFARRYLELTVGKEPLDMKAPAQNDCPNRV